MNKEREDPSKNEFFELPSGLDDFGELLQEQEEKKDETQLTPNEQKKKDRLSRLFYWEYLNPMTLDKINIRVFVETLPSRLGAWKRKNIESILTRNFTEGEMQIMESISIDDLILLASKEFMEAQKRGKRQLSNYWARVDQVMQDAKENEERKRGKRLLF